MKTKFNYGKIFLLGFGFFGVSVIWGIYNAFVPIFLAGKVWAARDHDRVFHDAG